MESEIFEIQIMSSTLFMKGEETDHEGVQPELRTGVCGPHAVAECAEHAQ